MSLDAYWKLYDVTLERIAEEKPQSFADLKAILDAFQPPSSAHAFFPDGADDTLAGALIAAGWEIRFQEGTYVYRATSPTGAKLTYVEGDLYDHTKTTNNSNIDTKGNEAS